MVAHAAGAGLSGAKRRFDDGRLLHLETPFRAENRVHCSANRHAPQGRSRELRVTPGWRAIRYGAIFPI